MSKVSIFIDSLSNKIEWLVTKFVFVIISGLVITTTAQVVFRVFFTALTWSEELSRYLLVWGTFFGATMAYKRGSHIALTFMIEAFGPKVNSIFKILINVLSIVFFSYVINYGAQMIKLQVFQISPALSLEMRYVYLCIPISMGIMIIHSLSSIIKELVSLSDGGEVL